MMNKCKELPLNCAFFFSCQRDCVSAFMFDFCFRCTSLLTFVSLYLFFSQKKRTNEAWLLWSSNKRITRRAVDNFLRCHDENAMQRKVKRARRAERVRWFCVVSWRAHCLTVTGRSQGCTSWFKHTSPIMMSKRRQAVR